MNWGTMEQRKAAEVRNLNDQNSSESLGNGGSPLLGDLNGVWRWAGVMALPGILACGLLLVYSSLGPEAGAKEAVTELLCGPQSSSTLFFFSAEAKHSSVKQLLPTMVMVAAVAGISPGGRFSTDQ